MSSTLIANNPPRTSAAVGVRDATRTFPGGVAALGPISLDVPAGQFIALLGPSGCGKTTLLRMIAGLDRPTTGSVACDAAADPTHAGIGYVFQDAHLLPWRSALRNVALPLELRGVPKAERVAAAREALRNVGLTDAADRYPAQLSGGMRMRVSLARALVTGPRLLLMDEPFAALDEITRQHLDDQLRRLFLERGITVVFVTHSILEAAFLADRVVVMSRRPGRIVLDRTLDLPAERLAELRTDAHFALQMRELFHALERGERGAA